MVEQDKIIGGIMAGVGVLGIILEFIFLIIQPLADQDRLLQMPRGQYWAMAIPLFLAIVGVLGIVTWIGITMIQTPPPEVMEFEDFEDIDLDKEEEEVFDEEAEDAEDAGDSRSLEDLDGVSTTVAKRLRDAGFDTVDKIAKASVDELTDIKGIGKVTAGKIKDSV